MLPLKRKLFFHILIVILLGVLLDGVVQFQLARMHRQDQILDVSMRIAALRAQMEKEINSNLLVVQGMADFISVLPDLDERMFAQFARKALEEPGLLKNLTAAPDYVMKFVYPLQGNEAILGINYRELPGQWEQAFKARQRGKMVIAGPLKLIQGGIGLIGRVPVFIDDNGKQRFWGIVSAVIDLDTFFKRIELDAVDLEIAIRGKDGKGAAGDVFLGSPNLFAAGSDAVEMPVTFPAGSWVIAATPTEGWSSVPPLSMLVHSLVGFLVVAIALAVYRAGKRDQAIHVVKDNLNQAQAIAHLGSWELDLENDSLWWSNETYRIYGVDQQTFSPSLQGFMTMVHPDDKERVLKEFHLSVDTCDAFSIEHRILRPDGSIRHVLERGHTICRGEGTPAIRSTGTVQDVTERKHAEDALRAGEEKMRAMSEASYDALIVIDARDVISFWNPAAEKMLGWTSDEVLGKRLHKLITPEKYHHDASRGLERFRVNGQGPVLGKLHELTAIRKNGEEFPVELSVTSFKQGDFYYAVSSLRDVTEVRRKEERLRIMATTDEMTGLFNRRRFIDLVDHEIKRSRRYPRPLSLIMFDADRFKSVNDTYGHNVGDTVLRSIAATSKNVLRGVDILGRIGGEEFAVGLPETRLDQALLAAEKLRAAVEQAHVRLDDGRVVHFTVSLGVAELDDTCGDVDDLLKHADMALYAAKENGRNRVEKYPPDEV